MTRLTNNDVKDLSENLGALEDFLVKNTGRTLKKLACEAVGMWEYAIDTKEYTCAVVPVTTGEGIISNFSESVRDICKWLGFEAFVTEKTDISGFKEALEHKPNIIFMADDVEFLAYNIEAKKASNNTFSTAKAYIAALSAAADMLIGKDVLIVGAGRVGSEMARLLVAKSANVTITDIDLDKAYAVQKANPRVKVAENVREAIRAHKYILNASPAHIETEDIQEGAIISSPGVPHTFDEEAKKKALIIHDPLAIGVAAMAMESAYYSYLGCRK